MALLVLELAGWLALPSRVSKMRESQTPQGMPYTQYLCHFSQIVHSISILLLTCRTISLKFDLFGHINHENHAVPSSSTN